MFSINKFQIELNTTFLGKKINFKDKKKVSFQKSIFSRKEDTNGEEKIIKE